jgi:hypothetical protein
MIGLSNSHLSANGTPERASAEREWTVEAILGKFLQAAGTHTKEGQIKQGAGSQWMIMETRKEQNIV